MSVPNVLTLTSAGETAVWICDVCKRHTLSIADLRAMANELGKAEFDVALQVMTDIGMVEEVDGVCVVWSSTPS